jgi:hypothetical protein
MSSEYHHSLPMRLTLIRVTISSLFSLSLAAGSNLLLAQGEPQSPFAETAVYQDCGNGLRWTVFIAQMFAATDSIWISAELQNASDQSATLRLREGALFPEIVVHQKGGPTISRRPDFGPATTNFRFDQIVPPGKPLHSFRTDLRAWFGKLPPGEYEVHLIWEQSELDVAVDAVSSRTKLQSGTAAFKVIQVSAAEAEQALGAAPKSLYRSIVPRKTSLTVITDVLPAATLTNRLPFPLQFQYRKTVEQPGAAALNHPLRVPMLQRRWVGGWRHADSQTVDKTRLGTWTLAPGESVEIVPDERIVPEDGIFSYSFWSFTGNPDKPDSRQLIDGDPIIVDRLAADQPLFSKRD